MAIEIMKKLNIAVALALGLVMPFGAIAATSDDEVTIRMMEMHEKSSSSVMNRIELSDTAIDKVSEETNSRKRFIEGKTDGDVKGEGTGEGIAEMDMDRTHYQERLYDQDQDREMDLVQDQIRDSVPKFKKKPETGNGTGSGK